MVRQITIQQVEYVAHELARKMMNWSEPIPDFSTRFPGKLESCLATPFQKFDRKNLYHGLAQKGAMLFYLMIKNHPFQNGNKRVAVTTLLVFLYLNNKWLKVSDEELYRFAVLVAGSPAKLKDGMVSLVEYFIGKYVVDAKETNKNLENKNDSMGNTTF